VNNPVSLETIERDNAALSARLIAGKRRAAELRTAAPFWLACVLQEPGDVQRLFVRFVADHLPYTNRSRDVWPVVPKWEAVRECAAAVVGRFTLRPGELPALRAWFNRVRPGAPPAVLERLRQHVAKLTNDSQVTLLPFVLWVLLPGERYWLMWLEDSTKAAALFRRSRVAGLSSVADRSEPSAAPPPAGCCAKGHDKQGKQRCPVCWNEYRFRRRLAQRSSAA
jgi:hypothetical protein